MKITLERERVVKELVEYEVHCCYDCPYFQVFPIGDTTDWQKIYYRCFCSAAPFDDNIARIFLKLPTRARLKEQFSTISKGCPYLDK